jgi:nicotinate-nucleotide pyrophosphorylase (carboxylating)
MPDAFHALEETVTRDVTRALAEDVGTGDLTAALIPADRTSHARLLTRQSGVLCGVEWFRRTFEELDPDVEIFWHHDDGDDIVANSSLCELEGRSRAILTGERTALNFVQLLSGVATRTRQFVRAVEGTRARILDTRKTLPGLRMAQKYAVATGGGMIYRLGLYDAVLIKENHILAAGGLAGAVRDARHSVPEGTLLQVEVETLEQLREALDAGAKLILLDNFDLSRRFSGTRSLRRRLARERARHRGNGRAPYLRGLPHEGRYGARPVHALPPSLKKDS